MPVADRLPSAYCFLARADRLLLLRIFLFATFVPMLLRLKLRQVQQLIEPHGAPRRPPADRSDEITRYVDVAIRYGRPIVRSGCLTRGVTLYFFLRRAGLDVSLWFGMGRVEDEFVGHCWIVRDGEPYRERVDPRTRYAPVYAMPHGPVTAGPLPTVSPEVTHIR